MAGGWVIVMFGDYQFTKTTACHLPAYPAVNPDFPQIPR